MSTRAMAPDGSSRWHSHAPSRHAHITIRPSPQKAYVDSPNIHCGTPHSACIGASATSVSPSVRYRFHHPVLSDVKCTVESGDHEGSKIDSRAPPATRLASRGVPEPSTRATHSSQPSHGMFGWFQVSHNMLS